MREVQRPGPCQLHADGDAVVDPVVADDHIFLGEQEAEGGDVRVVSADEGERFLLSQQFGQGIFQGAVNVELAGDKSGSARGAAISLHRRGSALFNAGIRAQS